MIVTLALLGPFVQSVALTGGNFDSAVGPGVGFWVTTVQPESGRMEDSCATDSITVGAGLATVVEVEVGIAWVWGRQPTRAIAMISINDKNTLRIQFSIDKYLTIV